MRRVSRWNLGRKKELNNSQDHHDDSQTNEHISNSKAGGKIKIITDEPTLEDALDFDRYSQELADIIMNSTPRFTIGIFGGWGTGKTTLMKMIEKKLKDNNHNDILVVWFDAWKYEKEKYLAIVPFIRTIKIALENSPNSKSERWNKVRQGLGQMFNAFINSTNVNLSLGTYGSTQINLAKFMDTLRADGSIIVNGERVYYHTHVTDYLAIALSMLRTENPNSRIVAFIDDLDRCAPDNALEVLESIKTFFDIEGMVYVIGMDSESINSIVKKKYGDNFSKGLDYMQKIVQLPFQIPTWKEVDISKSISKIISIGLRDSEFADQFEKNKKLVVKAIQLNPREIKRFINNVILARLVLGKPIDELIAVQALNFNRDWKNFLELITPDVKRKAFLDEYKKLMEEDKVITTQEELDKLGKELYEANHLLSRDIVEIYRELLKQDNNALRSFLDAGAVEILLHIDKMEEHRRALDTTKLNPTVSPNPTRYKSFFENYYDEETNKLLKLLHEDSVQQFNEIRAKSNNVVNFSEANLADTNLRAVNLSDANLRGADLSGTDLSSAFLTRANLRGAKLLDANLADANLQGAFLTRANLQGAFLTRANLQGAFLNRVKLSNTDLSNTDFSSSIILGCEEFDDARISENTNFDNAIVDKKELLKYLNDKNAANVPPAIQDKNELEEKLKERGFSEEEIMRLLPHSSLPIR
jgi:hypothetical protein